MAYSNQVAAAWVGAFELIGVAAWPASERAAGRQSIGAFVNKATITRFSNP